VSGLALSEDGRLFAHDDERAIIHEVDPSSGRIQRSFRFGKGVKGDFEGLAMANGRFYLVTSDGVLYEGPPGGDGERVAYTSVDTRLGRSCEIEGLAHERADDVLLMACKTPRLPELKKLVTVFRWSRAGQRLASPGSLQVPLAAVAAKLGTKTFHPSGIERDPVTGHYVLLAGREAALVEISPEGELLAARRLDPSLHRKAEGITFLPDRTLVITDEAAGDKPMLTTYAPR
jgi:uncharacterized protein YjiK